MITVDHHRKGIYTSFKLGWSVFTRVFQYCRHDTSGQSKLSSGRLESYELYTVCSALVRWRGLCRIFAYRTRHTLCVARLFVGVAYVGSLLIERGIHSGVARLFVGVAYVGSLFKEQWTWLIRCIFHSTTPTVELRQLVRSYKLWKVFFHLCHVDSIGHDWSNLRLKQSKIRLRFNIWFRSRTSHVPNIMH